MRISIIIIIFITVITVILNSQINAQSTICSGGSDVNRADGLVSSPQLSGIFNTSSGRCIINDYKAAFASFTLPTYEKLKSLYYTQAKSTGSVAKENPLSSLPNEGIVLAGGKDHLYYFTGNLALARSNDIKGNRTGVIFVDGNLTIGPIPNSELTYGSNDTGLVFVVGGDVVIDKTITRIDAVIISSGTIFTAGEDCLTSKISAKQLVVNGSLIPLDIQKPIKFCRNLGVDNETKPAEKINQQPKYLVILKDIFFDTFRKWSEVVEPI